MSTRYEYLIAGRDGARFFGGASWQGQTFKSATAHTVAYVRLPIYKNYGTPGTITCSLRATSSGLPTGADLCSGTITGNLLVDEWVDEWTQITFIVGYAITANVVYAIVVRGAAGDSGWRHDESSPPYANGQVVQSADSGGSWEAWSGGDNLFEEWGDVAAGGGRARAAYHHHYAMMRN